ncbi:hypothetical protein K8R32_01410 [bacterium]|nr:hypothetical protein [bacterium]
MDYKKNLTPKKIFQYTYILIILINFVCIYYLYTFTNKFVYQTFFTNREYLISQGSKSSDDINLNKFDTIINKINKKSLIDKSEKIPDIFN